MAQRSISPSRRRRRRRIVAAKDRLTAAGGAALERRVPRFMDAVEVVDVATPITSIRPASGPAYLQSPSSPRRNLIQTICRKGGRRFVAKTPTDAAPPHPAFAAAA